MGILRKILFPFALLYGMVVYLRNWCYDRGIFKSHSVLVPSICIGNLSVGGTGKTPMVAYLIELLKDQYSVGVLSRGYKRKSKGFTQANALSGVEDLGDEPFLLFRNHPEIALAVDANRHLGILQMLNFSPKPELILLDDAFQHRRINPGFFILLTAYGDLYPDDFYLPTGNLRDHKNQAGRADIIIVTKCPEDISEVERKYISEKLKPEPHQKLFFSYIKYDTMLRGRDSLHLSTLGNEEFCLVTGIANPKPLAVHLKSIGLQFEHLQFPDHHFFTETDLRNLRSKKRIVTTEKDFVRLENRIDNLFYLPITMGFVSEKTVFDTAVRDYIKS